MTPILPRPGACALPGEVHNAAIHRVALTQARSHNGVIALLNHRTDQGATRKQAIRSLKRRLSDAIYRAMLADAEPASLDIGGRGDSTVPSSLHP
jgi:hypothetical protein